MNKLIRIFIISYILFAGTNAFCQKLLIPMDLAQTDHLKAYGIIYWALTEGNKSDWLLNYRGGSFMLDNNELIASECRMRGVFYESIDGASASRIYAEVQSQDNNMDVVKLEKAPRIAVYAPPGTLPWDDAVLLALDYAEVKHEIIWDEDVIMAKLENYDWLHLHHEDFTGQYGKFWVNYANAPWHIEQVALNESMAKKLGFAKVSEMKRAVALKIRQFMSAGGFLFAMCSAADSYDMALAAQNVDMVESVFDGDPADPQVNEKLDFSECLAFENFHVITDPYIHEVGDIDVGPTGLSNPDADYFTLFDFSAKFDPVPTMLIQDHANIIHGFLGQSTAFHKNLVKKSVTVLAERQGTDEVKYLHGNLGRGTFTFYGGHDPEDYQHLVGDAPTELKLHKNSPGYRLILNNILFPAARKKKQKT